MHSRMSMTFLGDLEDSRAFFDLKHSIVLEARKTINLSFHFFVERIIIIIIIII